LLNYDSLFSCFELNDSELHIIKQINEGNIATFKSLYDTFYTCLLVYANSIINDIGVSKDIVQDIFLKLWEKRNEFTIKYSLKSYLYTAVRNSCMDYLKHLKVEKKYIDHSLVELKEKELTFFSELFIHPEEDDFEKYLNEITTVIEELPEQCRKIFKLSRFEGMKNNEVARYLNLSVRTIDTQLYRALKTLREKLNKYLTCK
jgi:RNA polymerase sigma-19 factor, ECF subfamily